MLFVGSVVLCASLEPLGSFFAFLREYVAEPLPEGMQQSSSTPPEDGEIEMDLEDALADPDSCEMDDYSQWIMGHPVGGIGRGPEDQKWINHCRLSDLFMQYKFNFVPNGELEAPAGQAIKVERFDSHPEGKPACQMHGMCQVLFVQAESQN